MQKTNEMKRVIINISFIIMSFTGFCQSERTTSNCTVPAGWTSCNTSCMFSECCIVWNPKESEGGCGCWFGVAKCKTGLIASKLEISNKSSADATVKFSFDRFNEFINFLNSKSILTDSILLGFNNFKRNYTLSPGMISVQSNHYIEFEDAYINFINKLTNEQKTLVMNFISDKEKPR